MAFQDVEIVGLRDDIDKLKERLAHQKAEIVQLRSEHAEFQRITQEPQKRRQVFRNLQQSAVAPRGAMQGDKKKMP
jgi:hypothetical protein